MEIGVNTAAHNASLRASGRALQRDKQWRPVDEAGGHLVPEQLRPSDVIAAAAGRSRHVPSQQRRRNDRGGRMYHPHPVNQAAEAEGQHRQNDMAAMSSMQAPPSELLGQSMMARDAEAMYGEESRNGHDGGSASMDGVLSGVDERLQEQIQEIGLQREQLFQEELRLRAQVLAQGDVARLQSLLEEQRKSHSESLAALEAQVNQKSQQALNLEQQVGGLERELQSMRLETNEAVWAKEGLLQQQNNELSSLRRERENTLAEREQMASERENERAEHHQQTEQLKAELREKDRQLREMQEQQSVLQESLYMKDEQLQSMGQTIAEQQQVDAYSRAELTKRAEEASQYWATVQMQAAQMAEMERYLVGIIQQLQQELLEARDQQSRGKMGGGAGAGLRSQDAGGKPGGGVNSSVNGSGGVNGGHSIHQFEQPPGIPMQPLLGMSPPLGPSGPLAPQLPFGLPQQALPPPLQPALQAPSLGQIQPPIPMLGPQPHIARMLPQQPPLPVGIARQLGQQQQQQQQQLQPQQAGGQGLKGSAGAQAGPGLGGMSAALASSAPMHGTGSASTAGSNANKSYESEGHTEAPSKGGERAARQGGGEGGGSGGVDGGGAVGRSSSQDMGPSRRGGPRGVGGRSGGWGRLGQTGMAGWQGGG